MADRLLDNDSGKGLSLVHRIDQARSRQALDTGLNRTGRYREIEDTIRRHPLGGFQFVQPRREGDKRLRVVKGALDIVDVAKKLIPVLRINFAPAVFIQTLFGQIPKRIIIHLAAGKTDHRKGVGQKLVAEKVIQGG